MGRAFLSEIGGKWSVVVRGGERPQEYLCTSREQAEKWLQLLDGPVREHRAPAQPLKGRAGD